MRSATTSLVLALCGLATLLASPAAAQSGDRVYEDPPTGSPSGTIYEIPLDQGRAEAAPRTGSGSGSTQPSSPIRSQNGFGSSSTVPGAATPAGGGSGGSGGSKKSSKSGSGSGAQPAKGEGETAKPVRVQEASGSASLPRSGALLALGILVAAAFAAGARFAARR